MGFLKKIFGKKETPITSYEDFWQWFLTHEKVFFKVVKERDTINNDFFTPLTSKLDQLRDGFYFQSGMFNDNTAELVFSAEGIIKNIVFVEELVNSAPQIDGWKFTALKQPLDIADVYISMAECNFTKDNISFYYTIQDNCPDEIDITLVHHDFDEAERNTYINGTFIFLDHYLGELESVTSIDNIKVIAKEAAEQPLIPIDKLKDFLLWRQKEFVEKYEGIRYNTENDTHSIFESELESGNNLIAVINTELLQWDAKASHPWILEITIPYNGENTNGMPDTETYELLNVIQNEIDSTLKDTDGYLNVGRETANGIREIYFACKDFRKPAQIADAIQKKYANNFEIEFRLYIDKYWQSFNRFSIV